MVLVNLILVLAYARMEFKIPDMMGVLGKHGPELPRIIRLGDIREKTLIIRTEKVGQVAVPYGRIIYLLIPVGDTRCHNTLSGKHPLIIYELPVTGIFVGCKRLVNDPIVRIDVFEIPGRPYHRIVVDLVFALHLQKTDRWAALLLPRKLPIGGGYRI